MLSACMQIESAYRLGKSSCHRSICIDCFVYLINDVLTEKFRTGHWRSVERTHRARTEQIQSFQGLAPLARELSAALQRDCVDNSGAVSVGWWRQTRSAQKLYILFISFVNQGDGHARSQHHEADRTTRRSRAAFCSREPRHRATGYCVTGKFVRSNHGIVQPSIAPQASLSEERRCRISIFPAGLTSTSTCF